MLDLLVMSGVNMVCFLEIRIICAFKIVTGMRMVGRFPSLVVSSNVFEVQKLFLRIIHRCNLSSQSR